MPAEGSTLHRGFQMAGLLEVLPDFAIAMDAFLFGARRAMEIHLPTCSKVSHDEATLVALCGLAQAEQTRLDRALAQRLGQPLPAERTAAVGAGEALFETLRVALERGPRTPN